MKVNNDFEELFVNTILNKTQYSGGNRTNKKIISASGLTDDLLILYYKYKYEPIENKNITQSTIGSLAHIGVEEAFKGLPNSYPAERLEMPLSNGWTLSGEYDVMLELNIDGKDILAIIDFKLIKNKKVKTLFDVENEDNYSMQCRAYKYLVQNAWDGYKGQEVRTYLACGVKDGTLFKNPVIKDFEFIEIKNDLTDEVFDFLVREKTSLLQEHIDVNKEPEMCEVLFFNYARGLKSKNGKKIPLAEKCLSFCDYKNVCKHGKKFNAIANRGSVIDMLGL